MPLSYLDVKARIADANEYVRMVNALGHGVFELRDGGRFPEYVEVARPSADAEHQRVLPTLKFPRSAKMCDICAAMLAQLRPHIEQSDAEAYAQSTASSDA